VSTRTTAVDKIFYFIFINIDQLLYFIFPLQTDKFKTTSSHPIGRLALGGYFIWTYRGLLVMEIN
jgi:hypothetical protein